MNCWSFAVGFISIRIADTDVYECFTFKKEQRERNVAFCDNREKEISI